MRVTVSHNKGREEASRIVEDTIANLLMTDIPKPFRVTDMRKQWMGSTLNFQTAVAMGPLRLPVRGVVQVSDTEVAIDIELPPLLSKFIPEHRLRDAVEARIRGHLAAPPK
jgi:hypothetical protein